MKTITIAELRQNPSAALHDVERGESYEVTRYRRVVARLVPVERVDRGASGDVVVAAMRATPLDADWAREIQEDRDADHGIDPWGHE